MENARMIKMSSRILCLLLVALLIFSGLPITSFVAVSATAETPTGGATADQAGSEPAGTPSTEAGADESKGAAAPLIPWDVIGKIPKSLEDDIAQLQPEDRIRVMIRVEDGYQELLADMLPEDAEVHFVYKLVPYVSATVKVADIEGISEIPYVISVLPDVKVTLACNSIVTPMNTSINDPYMDGFYLLNETTADINATFLWELGYTGQGVVIAILDTGIEESHPDLDDMDDDPTTLDPKVIGEVSFVPDESADLWDIHWHGTHVASIAAGTGAASQEYTTEHPRWWWWTVGPGVEKGVAPGAYLLDVKVLSAEGWGWESWVIAGIEWAVNHGADVISMSLGALEYSPAEHEAIRAATEKGVLVVAAAGNSGPARSTVAFPGGLPEVLSVGASTETSPSGMPGVIDFSSRGPALVAPREGEGEASTAPGEGEEPEAPETHLLAKPDVVAPGYMVMAAFAYYDTYQDLFEWWYGISFFDAWFYIVASGTSMSTPHASGAAALLLSAFPGATPEAIKAALTESALDLGYPAMVQGHGLINVGGAYELLENAPKGTYDQTESYMMNVSNYICEHPLLPQDFERNLTLVVDKYTRLDRYNILGEELMSRGMHAIALSEKLEEAQPWRYVELEEPIESPHPYHNDMWEVYTITHPGALSIKVHFEKIEVEQGWDYIYIYDADWNLIISYTGSYEDVWTPPVPGDTVYIVLDTDWVFTYWGFRVDAYMYSLPSFGFWLPFIPELEVYANAAGCNSTMISDPGADYMILNVSISLEGPGDNATFYDAEGNVIAGPYVGPYNYTGLMGLSVSEVNITVCSDNSTVEDDKEAQVIVYGYYTYPVTKNVLEHQGIDIIYIPDLLDPESLSELLPPEAVAAWVEQGGSLLFEGDDVWPPKTRYNMYTSYYNVTWSPNAEGRVYDTTNLNTTAFPELTEGVDTLSVGGAVASLLVESPAVTVVWDNFGHPIVAAGHYGEGKFVIIAPDMIINDWVLGGEIPYLTGLGDNLQFALNIFYWFTSSEKGKGSVEDQLVHDLGISWLSYPTLVADGEPLNFSAEIVNTGHYTENFTLWVYIYNCTDDMVFNGTRTYTNLENGTSIIDTWSYTPNLVRGVNDTVGLTIVMRIEYKYKESWPCYENNMISSPRKSYWLEPPGTWTEPEHGIWATIKTERAGPSPILTSATPSEIDGTTGMFVVMYPFDLNLLSVSFFTSGALVDANVTITGNVTEIVSFWNVTAVEIIDNPLIPIGPRTLIGPGLDVMLVEDVPRGTVVADLYMWTPLDVELGTYTGDIILYNSSGILYTMPITLEIREPAGSILYEDLSWAGIITSYIWPWMEYYDFWTSAAEAGYDVDLHWVVFWEAFTMYMEAWEDWLSLKPWERGEPPDFEEIYIGLLESLDYDAYMLVEPLFYAPGYGYMMADIENETEWCQGVLESVKNGSILTGDDPDWVGIPIVAMYTITSSGGSLLTLANTPYSGEMANLFIKVWHEIVGYYRIGTFYYPHTVYDPVVNRTDGEIGVEGDHYIFEGKDVILWTYEAYRYHPHGVYVGLYDTDLSTVMAVGLDVYAEPPYSDYDYANYAVIVEADCTEGAWISGGELVAFAGYDLFTNEILEYGDLYMWYSYPFRSEEDGYEVSTWPAGYLGDNVRLLEQLLEVLCNRPPEKEVTFDKEVYTAGENITVTLNVTDDLFPADEIYVEAELIVAYFNKTLFEQYPSEYWRWYEWDVVSNVTGMYNETMVFNLTIPRSAMNQTGIVRMYIRDGYGDEVCQIHEVEIVNRAPVITSVTPSEFIVTPGDEVTLEINVTDDSSSPEDIEVFVWLKYVDYTEYGDIIKCPVLVKTCLKQMATYENGTFTATYQTYAGPDSYWKWPTGRYMAIVIAMDEAGPISLKELFYGGYYEEVGYFIHYGLYPPMIKDAIQLYLSSGEWSYWWYYHYSEFWDSLQKFIDYFGTIDYLPMMTSKLWRTWSTSVMEYTTFIVDYEPAIVKGEIEGLVEDSKAGRDSTIMFMVYTVDSDEGLEQSVTFTVHLPDGTTETIAGTFAGRTKYGYGTWTAAYDLTGKPVGSYYVEATVTDTLGTSTTAVIGVFHLVNEPPVLLDPVVPQAIVQGESVAIVVTAYDPEGHDVSITISILRPDGVWENMTYTGSGPHWRVTYETTPESPTGLYTVYTTVVDDLGAVTSAYTGDFLVRAPWASADDMERALQLLGAINETIANWTGVPVTVGGYTVGSLTTSEMIEPPVVVGNVIELRVTGPPGTVGRTIVMLPKALLESLGATIDDVVVLFDGEPIDFTYTEYPTYYLLTITYTHSEHTITIHITGKLDTDSDGVPDWQEYVKGTESANPDSDGDFWMDSIDPWPLNPLLPNGLIIAAVAVLIIAIYIILIHRRVVIV